jgi:hypothetical protein
MDTKSRKLFKFFQSRTKIMTGASPHCRSKTKLLIVALATSLACSPIAANEGSVAAFLISKAVSGLAHSTAEKGWGWALGAEAASAQTDQNIAEIDQTLKDLKTELQTLESDIQALQCSIDVGLLAEYAGGIQSYFDTYSQFISAINQGATVKLSDIDNWANCAVGLPKIGQTCAIAGGVSVQTMLQDLYVAAAPSGGATGAIADCIRSSSPGLPDANTLDDRPWYKDNVEPITGWYLNIFAQGFAALTEAWHFRAWRASGSPRVQDRLAVFDAICPTGKIPSGCVDPINYFNDTFRPNVKAMLRAGGAPYSTSNYVIINNSDRNLLLARSIEYYNAWLDPTNSHSCTGGTAAAAGSLKSDPPCGPTVGKYNASFTSGEFGTSGYGRVTGGVSYGTWEPAKATVFADLLDLGYNDFPFSNVTASRFLCTLSSSGGDTSKCLQANGGAGLFVGSKIVLFPDLQKTNDSWWVENWIGHDLIRFMDGGLKNTNNLYQPFMNNSYANLLFTYGEHCTLARPSRGYNGKIYYRVGDTEQSSNPSFYIFSICGYVDGTTNIGDNWQHAPNFDPSNQVPNYRWPSLDWTTLPCSNGSFGARNSANMPTLCGKDFDIWFNAIAPTGPTTYSQTTQSDSTLMSARPHSNDGQNVYLSLGGHPTRRNHRRVVLAFDHEGLQQGLSEGQISGVYLILTAEALVPEAGGHEQAMETSGTEGIRITAYPMSSEFSEGDGDLSQGNHGSGGGATWNCAEEADHTDNIKDCVRHWPTPLFDRSAGVTVDQHWSHDSTLSFDITGHVLAGVSSWLLKMQHGPVALEDIDGSPLPVYYSREGAEALGMPNLGPRIMFVYDDKDDAD